MEIGNHKYTLTPLSTEIQINIQHQLPFNDYTCEYRLIMNGHEVHDKFNVDSYSPDPIFEQLVKRISNRIAVNLGLQLLQKSDMGLNHLLLKEP